MPNAVALQPMDRIAPAVRCMWPLSWTAMDAGPPRAACRGPKAIAAAVEALRRAVARGQ